MPDQSDSTANLDEPPDETVASAATVDAATASRSGPDGIEQVLVAWADHVSRRETGAAPPAGLPVLPAPRPESDDAEALRGSLRRFHAGHAESAGGLELPGDDFLPALLHPFRDPERVRHDYPLVLNPPDPGGDEGVAAPLGELLETLAEGIAPGRGDSRILKDNLPRLERCVRESLDGSVEPVDAAALLSRAARATEQSLRLRGESGERLHEDLEKLVGAVPAGGSLLPLGEHTPLLLFLHVACERAAQRRAALRAEIGRLRGRLRDLRRLDDSRRSGADRPEALASSFGAGAQAFVDPAALARVVSTAEGAAPRPSTGRERIDETLATLDRHLAEEDGPLVVVVHDQDVPEAFRRPDAEWRVAERADVCREASSIFDAVAARYAALFGAMRLARLELDNAYDPSRHDRLRESFDWRSFTAEELLELPRVLALESAEHLVGTGMIDLSRLLLSGRPVNVLVTVQPATNPGLAAGEDPLDGYRFELAYLGVSHREAAVNQSSAARPDHLMSGFRRSLETTRAALHVVASGLPADGGDPPLGAWLHGGAALEGRAHPFFHYDPGAGETWARRLDFSTNPQPEADWPSYALPCQSEPGDRQDLTVAFTFADFALMERCYHRHFRVVPPEVTGEELVTLDAYLALPHQQARDRIPCIQAVDGRNRLHRLAISRRLAFACRDRLDYWHTLQELAGVRNEYVREALERQREELRAAFAVEREELCVAHAAALEQVRDVAAADAMRRLAEALLTTDVSALATDATAAARAPTVPLAPVAAPEAAPEAVPEAAPAPAPASEEPETEEPWINAALCTTCNDCLDINPRLFVYNANKQAVIGDPRAGTFEELVRAAEKCPARCIHPGTPLDPEEPNLEALIERAKPFRTEP